MADDAPICPHCGERHDMHELCAKDGVMADADRVHLSLLIGAVLALARQLCAERHDCGGQQRMGMKGRPLRCATCPLDAVDQLWDHAP
jgi:hypothetical protein